MELDPVHPILEDEDEDEDEEPPRILLYHGEPHGRAQGSAVRPHSPLSWGHGPQAARSGAGGRQAAKRTLACPTVGMWSGPSHGPWGPRLRVSQAGVRALPPMLYGRGQSRGHGCGPHESAWRMDRGWGHCLGELP